MLSFRSVAHSSSNHSRARSKALGLAAARPRIEAMEQRILLAMPTLWTTDGPGGGGALYNIAMAPNGQDLWVTSDMTGIYHSRDLGQSWQMVNFHSSAGGMNGGTGTQVQFSGDPNLVYITGSSLGFAKSTDGGANWAPVSGWSYGSAYWVGSDLSTTTKILVSNGSNLYLSTNAGASFGTPAYTSSNLYVGGAFFDGSNVYVGTNKGLLTSSNGGASFTLAAEQPGQTIMSFAGAKQGGIVRLLALTTGDSPSPGSHPWQLNYGGFYRLDVGGSWVDKTAAIAAVAGGVQGQQEPQYISMAENNINTVFTAGGGIVTGDDGVDYLTSQILKTSNGGDTWSDTYFLWPQEVTPYTPNANTQTGYVGRGGDFDWGWAGQPNGFAVCPTDVNKAAICDTFVHVTSDAGATWRQAYESPADTNPAGQYTPKHKAYHGVGLTETSVHYIDWISPTNIMASYTDIDGWRSTDGGVSWSHPDFGPYPAVVQNTLYKTVYSGGMLYGATSNVHDMYQSTHLTDASCNPSWQTGAVVVSADQGDTWSNIHSFGVPVIWIQIDPNNANRMYALTVDGVGSNGGIWVTNNLNLGASSTWTKLANPPRTQGHPYDLYVLNDGTLVATYSGRMSGGVFTDSSGVFISTDGGTTWTDRTGPNMHWYTKEITVDPTDPTQNTWYVGVFNGWGGSGANDQGDLYRTTDRGLTWTKMNLASVIPTYYGSIPIASVTINPATKEMYVTTEGYGILYTPDVTVPGLSASNFSDITSFPFVMNERVFINPYNSQDVWVASFGGGIVRGGVAPSSLAATATSATQVNLTWSDNSTNETGFAIDRATDAGFTQNVVTTTAGQNATSASITGLSAGVQYFFRIRATNGPNASANSASASGTTLSNAPTVTAVYVRGSSWASGYLSFLAANMSGSSSTYGYAIPVGSGATQLQTLPWRNLNHISIAFREDVSVSQAQFAIVGSVGSYNVSSFSYNSTDHVATWSLSAVIGADKLYVALPGGGATPVTDTAGNALDGEWTNPTSYSQSGATDTFPSGNGVAGGDFAFRFDVLPGDSTGGSLGKVNVADINQTKSRSSLPETTSSYRSDFDGNDLVNVADINYAKSRSAISSLPVDPPVLPTFGPVFSPVSLLLSRAYPLLGKHSFRLW